MTFKIAPFVQNDYTDILIAVVSAPEAPYEPNVITTAFMGVIDKAVQTGALTAEQGDYLIQRVAVETGVVQAMLSASRTVAAAGGSNANKQLDTLFANGVRRVTALNNGGLEGMLADDAKAAGREFVVLKVDENTTKEEFNAAWEEAGLATGNEVKRLEDMTREEMQTIYDEDEAGAQKDAH